MQSFVIPLINVGYSLKNDDSKKFSVHNKLLTPVSLCKFSFEFDQLILALKKKKRKPLFNGHLNF